MEYTALAVRANRREAARAAIDNWPDILKTALILRYVEGMNDGEIGLILGIGPHMLAAINEHIDEVRAIVKGKRNP